jgi:hypothetical protein
VPSAPVWYVPCRIPVETALSIVVVLRGGAFEEVIKSQAPTSRTGLPACLFCPFFHVRTQCMPPLEAGGGSNKAPSWKQSSLADTGSAGALTLDVLAICKLLLVFCYSSRNGLSTMLSVRTRLTFFFFFWHFWGLNLGPCTWATPPALFTLVIFQGVPCIFVRVGMGLWSSYLWPPE